VDKKPLAEIQARKSLQEKIEGTEEKRPIHIQIRDGNTQ
jgi:hypothetical protein